ncbi:MAG: YaeQ family protein [Alcanivoracaceae bacterium]
MALPSTLYTFRIDLADQDRGHYDQLKLKLPCHPSETVERLVVRALAWCLFDSPDLKAGPDLSDHSESPLYEQDASGEIRHRIELGEPDPQRIKRASNRGTAVTVITYTPSAATWWKKQENALRAFAGTEVLAMPADVISALASDLPRQLHWQVMVSERTLFISDESGASTELPVTTWQDRRP